MRSRILPIVAAIILALLVHGYYVEYGVSNSKRTMLDLSPVPALPGDSVAWNRSLVRDEARQLQRYRRGEGWVIDRAALEEASESIFAQQLYMGLLVPARLISNAGTERQRAEDMRKAKEKSFWLGIVLPLLIVVFGVYLATLRAARRP